MNKAKWYDRPIYVMVALALVLSVGITALPLAEIVEAVPPCQPDVWVDDTGPSCPGTGNGTQADPYCTIQEGVNHVCDGGTVHVLPGKYDGGITVVTPNVTIESIDGAQVTTVDDTSDNGFVVGAQGVTIDGFTITGFGGGTTSPAPEGTGDSFEINFYHGCGIILTGGGTAHNCTIKNNIIENNGHGILIETDNNQILYNNILNNSAVVHSGVHLSEDASGNEIHCNNIEGNLPGVAKGADYFYGVGNEVGGTVNGTNNYWGCSEGPGAAGCDTFSGNVLFNPFLREPFQHSEVCGGTPPTVPPRVPTTSHWGVVAMITLFAGFLVWTVRRRRLAS